MKPYYADGGIALFHGDCRELLPEFVEAQHEDGGIIDMIFTDPPYGIEQGAAFVRDGGAAVAECGEESFNALVAEREWIPQAAALLRDGGYFATFCDTKRIRETEDALTGEELNVWRRFYLINSAPPPTPRPTFMSGVQECVIAWKGEKREWYGGGCTPNYWIGVPATRGKHALHPAEKPLEAISLLGEALCAPNDTLVLDPFAGSGTTLRWAQLSGRRAIGIEIEEKRCEEIVRRLRSSVRTIAEQPVLF